MSLFLAFCIELLAITNLFLVCNIVQKNHASTVAAVHECITDAIGSLLYYPEAFDEVAQNLISYLTELIQDDDSLTVVIDELVDQVRFTNTSGRQDYPLL
jgi:hypothetical protein